MSEQSDSLIRNTVEWWPCQGSVVSSKRMESLVERRHGHAQSKWVVTGNHSIYIENMPLSGFIFRLRVIVSRAQSHRRPLVTFRSLHSKTDRRIASPVVLHQYPGRTRRVRIRAVWVDPVLRPYIIKLGLNTDRTLWQYVTVYSDIRHTVYSTCTRLYFCNIQSVCHRRFTMVRP